MKLMVVRAHAAQYNLTRAGISVARCVRDDDDGRSVPEIALAPCNSSVDAANGGFGNRQLFQLGS